MVQDMPRATECFSAICSLQERDKLVPASNLSAANTWCSWPPRRAWQANRRQLSLGLSLSEFVIAAEIKHPIFIPFIHIHTEHETS